ncbi:MAG: hypothetical protein GC191_05925 [Azospirillum sp.]|nr:hypothetical protein [Azospirillum sp.]
MGLPQAVVLAVAGQRLGELAWARRNTRRLLAAGAREVGAAHYPLFILLHGGWLAALFLLTPAAAPVTWWLLGFCLALQIARLWVIATLGRYWTTRVITLPAVPLVRRGPYRWCRHPNYLIVIAEIAALPLAFGQWRLAALFSVLNLGLLWHRLRIEDAALAERIQA